MSEIKEVKDQSIVQVSDISVKFGEIVALDDVSLSIPEGQVRGLLGPNGAGKTTLVNVISTLIKPNTGSVHVCGFNAVTRGYDVRTCIGLAGQYAAVDELLTGRENLEIVGRLYQLKSDVAKKRATEILERLSLTDAGDRQVKTYSGGMRRRLDLGASLVGRPQVLILDEPTTGLDPRTRIELWEFLSDLVSEGTTVLLTTQYLEEADKLANYITLIDQGKIIAEGSPENLKSKMGEATLVVTPVETHDLDGVFNVFKSMNMAEPRINELDSSVVMKSDSDPAVIVAVAQKLQDEKIKISDISLKQPTLDEVFLRLTKGGSSD